MKWTCHICGDERPDVLISVHSRTITTEFGVSYDENVRYCNDRQSCAKGAQTFSFTKPKPATGEVEPWWVVLWYWITEIPWRKKFWKK